MEDCNLKRKELIQLGLKAKNITQSSIAELFNVKEPSISGVISGEDKSERIMKHIAKILDLTYNDLWGVDSPSNIKIASIMDLVAEFDQK